MNKLSIFLFALFAIIMPDAIAGDLAKYKFFYGEGIRRFYKGDYVQAYKNFKAASICEDAEPEGLKMMKLSEYCRCHFDTAEVCYGDELYQKALYHYSVVAQNNSHDMLTRSKMTLCIKKNSKFENDMVLISGGRFMMGNNNGDFNEQPSHNVILDAFYMDKTEVCNSSFVVFLNTCGIESNDGNLRIDLENPFCRIKEVAGWYYVEEGFEQYPVVAASWYGANDYAKWIGKTLPTEAQWEYAFADADKASMQSVIAKVGTGTPNKFGLYNMGGNVWEWCEDWYQETFYQYSPAHNPVGSSSDSEYKVMRGGAFTTRDEINYKTRRDYNLPSECKKNVGFRCVKNCPNYHQNTTTY